MYVIYAYVWLCCVVYVHTDAPGSPSVVIKNPNGGAIPPLTLVQAGVMCICRSAAWKSKVLVRAYWVYPDQVSKTAPTGQFLVQGSFMIRGKKNYIPEAPLVMGLGLLWR
jgi:predicted ribosome quality control (RQC) complex YloA/Tae2 family protein